MLFPCNFKNNKLEEVKNGIEHFFKHNLIYLTACVNTNFLKNCDKTNKPATKAHHSVSEANKQTTHSSFSSSFTI